MRNTGRVFVPNTGGVDPGNGVWRSGGSRASFIESVASSLNSVAAYDAGFGRVMSGSSVTAWSNLLNPATHSMIQPGATTLCPAFGSDARGAYLSFDGGDHLYSTTLGSVFAGTSVPFWVLGVIDGMTRTAGAQCLFGLASASANQFAYVAPNSNATSFAGSRTDADGAELSSSGTNAATEGVVADLYDGTTRTTTFGAVTGTPRAHAGVLNTGRASIGALRFGSGPTVSSYLQSKVRGLIVGTTITPAALAAAAATLKSRYGM